MFERFKNGLFKPREVLKYQYDKKIITFLYFLLLVLISIIPSVILSIKADGLEYSDQLVIRSAFKSVDIPYKIENYQLVKKTSLSSEDFFVVEITDTLKVIFLENESDRFEYSLDPSIIVFITATKVYYGQSLLQRELFSYTENLKFKDLDFSGATTDNSQFWDIVFPVVNQQIDRYLISTLIIDISIIIIVSALLLVFFSMIVAFFQKLSLPKNIKFTTIWQLIIYLLTPFVILQLIENLYSIGFLSLIGIFITIRYVNIISQELIKT